MSQKSNNSDLLVKLAPNLSLFLYQIFAVFVEILEILDLHRQSCICIYRDIVPKFSIHLTKYHKWDVGNDNFVFLNLDRIFTEIQFP